jgi:hypothetical protein
MKELINQILQLLPTIAKEEADYIEEIINWPHEQKTAFLIAKQIFEEKF